MERGLSEKHMVYLKLIAKAFKFLVLTVLIILILLVSAVALGQLLRDERGIAPWGAGFFLIASGSMEPEIPVGSLILVKRVSSEIIAVGDVVTFLATRNDTVVTHRVREVRVEESGYVFITRGDANNTDDPPLTEDRVIGRVIFTAAGVREVVNQFRNIRALGIAIISAGLAIGIVGFLTRKLKSGDEAH
jgi:signal peptidase